MQEAQVGSEKVAVAQILKDHNVLVRGGPEQGTRLMDALVVRLCCQNKTTGATRRFHHAVRHG